jgi:hypothetical protein
MIAVIPDGAINRVVLLCDGCGKEITDAADGMIAWDPLHEGQGPPWRAHVLHKGRGCDTRRYPYWNDLPEALHYIETNVNLDREETEARLRRLAGMGLVG